MFAGWNNAGTPAKRLWPALLGILVMVGVAACAVVGEDQPAQATPTLIETTPTSICGPGKSDIACEDRAAATALSLTPLPPPTLSAEFLTAEAEYRAQLSRQPPTAWPPAATPTPSFTISSGPEEGTVIYQGRSSYQEQPRFEIVYRENIWRMAGTAAEPTLAHRAIIGCEIGLMPIGMGMAEAPEISQQELAGYSAEVRGFPKSGLISYGFNAAGGYYLFRILLPGIDTSASLDECRADGEAVLNTFKLKQD